MSADPGPQHTRIRARLRPTERQEDGCGALRGREAFRRRGKPTGEHGGPVGSREINGSAGAGIKYRAEGNTELHRGG